MNLNECLGLKIKETSNLTCVCAMCNKISKCEI